MSAIPEIPSEPIYPDNWPPHPRKKMVMTPLMATVGALLAFATVVFMVVYLPTTTFEPPPSDNWRPLTDLEMQGRNVFLANGCIYCHSGFTRPQDIYADQYYVYSRVSEPGDYMGAGETPNLFGTIRTGPDLSQAGGFHPDDWHYAHYTNARYTTPISIMPSFEFLSLDEIKALIAFTQSRGGKLADMRMLHQQNLKAFEQAVANIAAPGEKGDRTDGFPSAGAIDNLMLMERGYWTTSNPLPVTTQNLVRGRQIFEERCIGCHGSQGDGNGPAAFYFNPPPAAFNVADDQEHGSDTSPGAYYWRILRGIPGSAMENFGTRLSVDDIWKVVLFIKTIPNGGLTAEVPTPDMYIQWKAYPEFYKWVNCFAPQEDYYFQPSSPTNAGVDSGSVLTNTANVNVNQAITPSIMITNTALPSDMGDMPAMVPDGEMNPSYAVTEWMTTNNARPCGSKGFENVTLLDILAEVSERTDGFARQGVDQVPFIPTALIDQTQLTPQLIDKVWGQDNPGIKPAAGNK
ncbi:MAG: cbb3-type cytochrome c oxidase subunit II [Caldilineaceae bacterium]|nr:cbb3-type cytochrome c oxidase subunit II [Caldilineaceae bacterium]